LIKLLASVPLLSLGFVNLPLSQILGNHAMDVREEQRARKYQYGAQPVPHCERVLKIPYGEEKGKELAQRDHQCYS